MTITARFSSTCPTCHRQIAAGEQVEWNRGEKARHADCQPSAQQPEPERIPVDQVGVYVLIDGAIVKVQPNAEKTRTYAKRWVEISGERLTEAGPRARGDYEYAGGLVAEVAAQLARGEAHRMTLEEARAFIVRYGQCARCGRGLKAAESVERGIGPTCMRYFGVGKTGADLITAAAA